MNDVMIYAEMHVSMHDEVYEKIFHKDPTIKHALVLGI